METLDRRATVADDEALWGAIKMYGRIQRRYGLASEVPDRDTRERWLAYLDEMADAARADITEAVVRLCSMWAEHRGSKK